MLAITRRIASISFLVIGLLGCASTGPTIPVDQDSITFGQSVSRGERHYKLIGTPVTVGERLPSVQLVDAATLEGLDLSQQKGSVLFLSIVPSLDTPVCDAQTHYLGEEGDKLSQGIRRITISRDTPFAQRRFARESELTDIQYLSDYKAGAFGRSTGLLMDDLMLLARSIILVDHQGIVRYIQVVPEMTHLPDMERAFKVAEQLAKQD